MAISFDDLISLGVIKYQIVQEDFIDRELSHVFLYRSGDNLYDRFTLQEEEVSGIVKAEFASFYELWLGEKQAVKIEGFEMTEDGKRAEINRTVSKDRFLPHDKAYYEGGFKVY